VNDTIVRVEDIAPIKHREAMELADAEYRRFTDTLGRLRPEDWDKQTVNDAWNVRQLVAHVLGFADSNGSIRENVHAMRLGRKRAKEKGYDHFIHGVNDMHLALLAYNRGPGKVAEILAEGGDPKNGYSDAVLKGYRPPHTAATRPPETGWR
jgi:hypothetical protein